MVPATRHKWTRLNSSQTDWYSIYLPRRDGRLSWPRKPITYTEMVYPPTDGHPSRYYTGSPRPGVELATCWSQVRRPYLYTSKPLVGGQFIEPCVFSGSLLLLFCHNASVYCYVIGEIYSDVFVGYRRPGRTAIILPPQKSWYASCRLITPFLSPAPDFRPGRSAPSPCLRHFCSSALIIWNVDYCSVCLCVLKSRRICGI